MALCLDTSYGIYHTLSAVVEDALASVSSIVLMHMLKDVPSFANV